MQHLKSILLVAGLAMAAPAPMTTKTPSTAVPPATTPAPSPSDDGGNTGGGVIYPSYTFGSTVINGQTYPIVGGALGGGARFTGSGFSITLAAGGYLQNCYAVIDGQVSPALCYGGSEEDTEVFVYGGQTLVDEGLGGSTDAAFSGKFPGPQSFSLAGNVGNPGGAILGGAVSGLITPALNPGNTANGGAGFDGTVTLGPISAGGLIGGSFVTQPGYTSLGGGAVGSAALGPLNGAGTIGGYIVGTTEVGCAGLGVEGVGYTACVTNPL